MSETLRPSDDDELLAAELAFRLLDATECQVAEGRLSTDAAFADAYRRWQDHAAGLLESPDAQPSPAVWNAIASRLPANDRRKTAATPRILLRFWQAATALATAAAVVLAVVARERPPIALPPPSQSPPPLVAILGGKGPSIVSVSFDRASRRLVVVPSGLAIGAHAAQLWVIPAGGAPHSLGLIEPAAPAAPFAPAAGELIAPGATLAISVEPVGGSPTGKPTGPVVVSGKIVEV